MNTNQKLTEARNLIDQVLNRNVGTIGHADLPAEALAQKQKLFSGLNSEREVFGIVNAINALAMANTDVVHVFTEFAPHINQFCVNVYGVSQDYISNPCIKPLIQELVFLADNEALEKLLLIESQLTELIIEAREEAEANAREHHPKHCIHGAILYGKCKKCAEVSEGGEA
ncbi:hypothetical protein R7R25_02295 [Vibrio sp. 2026]|uniref:hypothetical protein n=1 Tax=unclassified Vibrio TaxID=2614977 RepID=UPI002964BAF2|nr:MULTISPECIES: hypothetical protein [unclassified Vibrio]MDW2117437.1 hypothetical protein [Vibrio sp. 2026]MDW2205942.1 hypothetical protein [Vibrio sp. 2025]